MSEVSLKDIILSWKDQYGSDYTAETGTFKVIPTDSDTRKDLLGHLIKTLIENHQYKREDFSNMVRTQVIEACVNVYSKKKIKKQEWKEMVGNEYDMVLVGFFKIPIVEAKREEWESEGKPMPEALPPSFAKFADPENVDEIRKNAETSKISKIQPLDFKAIRENSDVLYDVEDEDLAKALGLKK
jgi:hypothetical protein